jgi:hypothetical protein
MNFHFIQALLIMVICPAVCVIVEYIRTRHITDSTAICARSWRQPAAFTAGTNELISLSFDILTVACTVPYLLISRKKI